MLEYLIWCSAQILVERHQDLLVIRVGSLGDRLEIATYSYRHLEGVKVVNFGHLDVFVGENLEIWVCLGQTFFRGRFCRRKLSILYRDLFNSYSRVGHRRFVHLCNTNACI